MTGEANPCPCPRCRKRTMGPWEPTGAVTATITGNQFKSTCASCGAVEMRERRPFEFWTPGPQEVFV